MPLKEHKRLKAKKKKREKDKISSLPFIHTVGCLSPESSYIKPRTACGAGI